MDAEAALAAYREAGGEPWSKAAREAVVALATHAPAFFPLLLAEPAMLRDVLSRPLARATPHELVHRDFAEATAILHDGDELRRVLRRLRHRALMRVTLREVLRLADVDRTSAEISAIAAAATDAALAACTRTAFARHGTPRAHGPLGHVVPFTVLGMGKLGGDELNLGSDVDLCFFYEHDDAELVHDATPSQPGRALTVHELYARIASATSQALSDVTEDGFCFRVDLRLRPEGTRGPLVSSLASAERYYETWGRTWERAALLRARPIAGDLAFGRRLLDALRPFVFRREVRPALAQELAELVHRARRGLGADAERDVKLGRGGIREAEFFVQSLQLIWGGRHPALQVPGTMRAVARLVAAGILTDREARDLAAGWSLLRRIEHRIHMSRGYQTHALPEAGSDEHERMARSLGFGDGAVFTRTLETARTRITGLFQSLEISEKPAESDKDDIHELAELVASGATADVIAARVQGALPVTDPDEAAAHLLRLARRGGAPLGPLATERAPGLGAALLRQVREAADADAALSFLADFFARLGAGFAYDKLLLAEPRLARRLVGLFGASATLSTALVGHPEEIDRILAFGSLPDEAEIDTMHAALDAHDDDTERLVAALRRCKREVTLRVGLAHVAGEADALRAERLLTALAEAQLRVVLAKATHDLGAGSLPLVVCGLGKLGGRELGFGSDLDVLFVYREAGEVDFEAPERATRVAQRTMRLLSQPDGEGPGYATDARLRPSGSHGMLVVSRGAFERYQQRDAAPWERQALVRARIVAGDPALGAEVAAIAAHAAFARGAPEPAELARLRRRMEAELAGEKAGRYHPKLGHGALVDVEFVVQFLQMRHGGDATVRLTGTLDAIGALRRAGHLGVPDAEALTEAWAFFRGIEQMFRLLDETREPVLSFPASRADIAGGRRAEQVARRIGVRDRDGVRRVDVLHATYARTALEVRRIFERLVAPVGLDAPFPPTLTEASA
jgi:glutamate-ammonia-ligase adenylyltransferase